jgi:Flp pilus assembly pilin Flp
VSGGKDVIVDKTRFAGDERGALVLEYVVVAMVGLMLATALVGVGVTMVNAYGPSLQILYSEYP